MADPPAFDPYEQVGDQLDEQHRGRPPSVGPRRPTTGRRPADEPAARDDLWPRPPRWLPFALIGGLFAAAIVQGVVRGDAGPANPADCQEPAVQVSQPTVAGGQVLSFTVTGPDARYVLGLGATGFTRRPDGGLEPVPAGGLAPGQVSTTDELFVTGCRQQGGLVVRTPPGEYPVTLYQLDLATDTSREVAQATVRVTG